MRFIQRLAVVSTAVLMGSAAAVPLSAAEKVKVDTSTPTATTTTFLKALGAGDVEAAKAASHGTEEHVKYLEAITSMFSGISRYERAAAKAFPNDPSGTTMAKGMSDAISGPDALKRIQKGKVTVTGQTATILPAEDELKPGEKPDPNAPAPKQETIQLRNVAGQWKLDLDSQFQHEQMRQQNPADMVKFGQAIEAVAADIEAGKYKTSIEAQAAFMKVIMEAHAAAQAAKEGKDAEAAGAKQEGEKPATAPQQPAPAR